MLAKTLAGLEDVLAKELRELGAMDIKKVKRGVMFQGDLGFLYKAHLWLRTALRILVPITEFKARNEKEIYKKVKAIKWEDYFEVNKTVMVNATVHAKQYRNTLFMAQNVKDAVVDRFRELYDRRPSVDTVNPDIRIDIYIKNENVVVSMDATGASLHKRGYRQAADVAPISEVLAAGILKLAGWNGMSNLYDPMCGSGTFLVEAALMAHNIPPNVYRKSFSFKNWKDFDEGLYQLLFDKALEKEKNFHYKIQGYDRESKVLMKARKNLKGALMDEQVKTEKADFLNFNPTRKPEKPGMLVFNPPYGEKLEADIPELYSGIGNTLKNEFTGYTAWVFTASQEGIKNIGLKPSEKIQLKNGNLDAWLLRFDVYEGSRKQKHQ